MVAFRSDGRDLSPLLVEVCLQPILTLLLNVKVLQVVNDGDVIDVPPTCTEERVSVLVEF